MRLNLQISQILSRLHIHLMLDKDKRANEHKIYKAQANDKICVRKSFGIDVHRIECRNVPNCLYIGSVHIYMNKWILENVQF